MKNLEPVKNAERLGQRITTTKTYERDAFVSEYIKRRSEECPAM